MISRPVRPTTLIALVGSVLLTACAHQGADLPREGIITPMAALHRDSIEERRQLAKRLRDAGELAAAVSQWKVLTILHPDDAEFRKELESTLATLSRSVAANYENGLAALKDGNNDEAARFMLQVLALEPGHTKAAKVLRGIEAEKIARVQIVRANRARSREDDSAKASPQESAASEMAEYRRSYDLEQTIEMFVAGDAQGGFANCIAS